jgi:hypothetical protein
LTGDNPILKIGISRGIADYVRQDAAQKFPTLLGSLSVEWFPGSLIGSLDDFFL